jgi:glycosyltransferase involved in cell wall biosynthesis
LTVSRAAVRPERIQEVLAKPIGIIIPTFNRSAALMECLAHLERQAFQDFEVVVVDDGSSDDTPAQMEAYQKRSPLSIRYFRQANSGPAKARNLAISKLESPLCLMLGDDIFASPTLVERHLRAHQENENIQFAALGLTRWSATGQRVTPFMRWLDEGNVQFSYPRLLAGAKPGWADFFTSNLSVKTELVRRFTFNEAFPYAAMEDMELAYRIQQRLGLEVKFLADAAADHLHPTTFRRACARMVKAGYSMGLFYDLWPERRPPLKRGRQQAILEAIARHPQLLKLLTAVLNPIADALCPQPFVFYLLSSHFEAGLQSQINSKQRLAPASA